MTASERELVIVLGQHRTGTSALAGALEACGLDFGPADKSPGEHNERGHFENPAINFLCEALLTPWTTVAVFGTAHEDLAERVLREYSGSQLGVKSREMLYLLPFWTRRAAKTRLVATLRHPLAFAHSYRARSVIDASSRGLDPARFVPELDNLIAEWRAYYEDIISLRSRISFPILDFDLPIEHYFLALERTVRTLGLQYRGGRVRQFVSDALRHHVEGDTPPSAVAGLYSELRAIAAAPLQEAEALTGEQILGPSLELRHRRAESRTAEHLTVGWQNAYTALTETTVQLQMTIRNTAARLADAQASFELQRAELLARFAESQAIHMRDREELLASFVNAQRVYSEQHATVLKSSATAQTEYERQYAQLMTRFAEAQAQYEAQRGVLLSEIAAREAQIAQLEAKSLTRDDAHPISHAKPADG